MWTNPKYANAAPPIPATQAAQPPEPTGHLVAEFPRPGKRFGKPDESLRLAIEEFNGARFLSLRIWTTDRMTGQAWPTKRGVSIRLGEADELAEAITRAVAIVQGQDDGPTPIRSAPRQPPAAPPRSGLAPASPAPWEDSQPFDEFA